MKKFQIFLFWNALTTASGFNTRQKIKSLWWFCIATDIKSISTIAFKICTRCPNNFWLENSCKHFLLLVHVQISIRKFSFMCISPSKYVLSFNTSKYVLSFNIEILDFATYIDLSCTSFTGICILVKNSSKSKGSSNLGQTIVQFSVSVW